MSAEPIPLHHPRRARRSARQRDATTVSSHSWDDPPSCAARPDLPWVVDGTPGPRFQAEMRAVCNTCPVYRQCAEQAVAEMPAGFYAGTWIPGMGKGRSEALKKLRLTARTETL